jgi:hypothetical protein
MALPMQSNGASPAHDLAVQVATGVRQAALAAATTQVQATAADVAFYQTVRTSANTNNLPAIAAAAQLELHALGVL